MLRKITTGVGLLTNETYALDFPLAPEEHEMLLREARELLSPERRERTAREFRDVLKAAGLEEPDLKSASNQVQLEQLLGDWLARVRALREDSLERLALEWLEQFHPLKNCEARLAKEGYSQDMVANLIDYAEELGRLQERIWWRQRPVPGTETKRSPKGKSPEKLALTRLPSERPFAQRNEGRDELNTRRKAAAQEWRTEAQALADDVWQGHPELSASAVASRVRAELGKRWKADDRRAGRADGSEPAARVLPKAGTIRRALKKLGST